MITKTDLQNTLSTYNAVVNNEISGLDDRVTTLESFHSFHNKRYGIRIDQSNSDPEASVTYLYDAVGKTPAGLDNNNVFDYGDWRDFVYDICKPVMLNPDGTVKYELDRNNQKLRADGVSASEYNDATQSANMMVQFNKWYICVNEPETDILEIVFSDTKVDENYHAIGFEDGTSGEVVEKDHFYVGMYFGSLYNSVYRSLYQNYSTTNETFVNERTKVQSNGSGWDMLSISQLNFILYLHYLIAKSRNLYSHFGKPIYSTYTASAPASIETGGFAGNLTTQGKIKSFWIEGFLGCERLTRVVGILASHTQNVFYIKHYPPYSLTLNQDEKTTITAPTHYGSPVYVKKMKSYYNRMFFENEAGATSSTYWGMSSHNDNQATSGVAGICFPVARSNDAGAWIDYNNGVEFSNSITKPLIAFL